MKIIDGNNMLHREAGNIGRGIHPVRSVVSRFSVLKETTIIVWDGVNGNWNRRKIFADYKSKRRPKSESQHDFFNIAKAALKYTPVIQIECYGWEADDVVGTLCERLHRDHELTVESNDGDYWQFSKMAYLPFVSKKWHKWSPEDLVLYKAMVGDPKDGIPGIPRFGDVTFNRLTEWQREQILLSIRTKDIKIFQKATKNNWPKSIPNGVDTFDKVCLYHLLNHYWTIPEEELDAGTSIGELNIPACEAFLGEFML